MSASSMIESKQELESKAEVEYEEYEQSPHELHTQQDVKHGDKALQIVVDERIELSAEDTDRHVLIILVWVYFLQILDKSVLGYGNVFGLSKDTHLVGNQYSVVSTMNAVAQLAWQSFASYLIVRVPARISMPILVFGWGASQACMAASNSYHSLVATRFLLGLFEAGCLPLFSILTAKWYQRSEQPIRVADWYSANGIATIVAAIISFGLAHVQSDHIESWQLILPPGRRHDLHNRARHLLRPRLGRRFGPLL